MRYKFFTKHPGEAIFEWNAASERDWKIIQRNFVAAYLNSYKDASVKDLMFDESLLNEAKTYWDDVYREAGDSKEEENVIVKRVINPLKFYFSHNEKVFDKQLEELKKHFSDKTYNINETRNYFIKLIMLQHYFEHDFFEEKHKIDAKEKKTDYLIVRFHENPIAFFVCELNYKSARIYLRWVTVEPAFHHQGLGEIILKQIVKHYPDAIGMELYTRKANDSAQKFYEHNGFIRTDIFRFDKPLFPIPEGVLYFPEDDATSTPNACVAFYK